MDQKNQLPEPFESDAAYLDEEFRWLKSHVAFLDLQRRREGSVAGDDEIGPGTTRIGDVDKVATQEFTRQLAGAKATTESARKALDTRLENHRKEASFQLGMDILTEQYSLSDDERTILLTLSVPAISGMMADEVLASMSSYSGSIQVGELAGLLKPAGTAEWMQYRQMFMVGSPLIRNGLVTIDYRSPEAQPGDLWSADVSLTSKAFGIITGDPSLMDTDDAGTGPEEIH